MDLNQLGFGIAGALGTEVIRRIAVDVEEAGFRTLWVNDTPGGDALAGLAAAADVTSTVGLATGVIPLDRQDADTILRRVRELQLPEERLTLGVGSGRAKQALRLVEEGVRTLREGAEARVVVGALGPRMRALAVATADGLVFNWLTVSGARQATTEMRSEAKRHGRPPISTALYVRTSLGPEAGRRLEQEARRYEAFPSYAANFARHRIRAVETAVVAATPEELRAGLERYIGAVDETVVRAITSTDNTEEYRALLAGIRGSSDAKD